jgi:NADH dehydrogenase [ubiquinone] 1 alpha subcomplex assembly factor 2
MPVLELMVQGLDLQGNTFWEFRDSLNSHKHRMRRIVQYPPSVHYSEINISPQWHQWLRHTRRDPPSIAEQSQDLVRQQNLKVLAAEADKRWAAMPSFLDAPRRVRSQPWPATEVKVPGGYAVPTEPEDKHEVRTAVDGGIQEQEQGTDVTRADGVRDGRRQHFNHRPGTEPANIAKQEKPGAADPWKKPREWEPKAWDGNFDTIKR